MVEEAVVLIKWRNLGSAGDKISNQEQVAWGSIWA